MSTMTDKAFWSRNGLNEIQKDRLLNLYEEVLCTIGQRHGPNVVREAMAFVETNFADPSTQLVAPEMPAVSWEPKSFDDLTPSESSQKWLNLQSHPIS